MTAEEEAFDRWHAKQVHLKGTRKTRDKAIVAAMDKAIEALLSSPSSTVDASSIQAWILEHLKFGDSIVSKERIDEHCLYQAAKPGTATKTFPQPKSNAALRVVREGVYGLATGKSWYEYEQRRHRNK
jgi:hypothetical protein